MRVLAVLVLGLPLGCLSPTVDLGANDSGKGIDSGAMNDSGTPADSGPKDTDSGSPGDSGCGTDCRTTNCAPPLGLCPSNENIACDPSSGSWVCVPPPDAGPTDGGGVCTVGQDWTCNDNPTMQALAGQCLSGDVCACNPGFMTDPATGRCEVAVGDAGCSTDCRITNCAPPVGWCPAQDTLACDSATGNWVCYPPPPPDGGGCYPPGNNGTCNGDIINASEGTCQSNGQCACTCLPGGPCYSLGAGGLCYAPMDFADGGTDAG